MHTPSTTLLFVFLFAVVLPGHIQASGDYCQTSIIEEGYENFVDIECYADYYNGVEYVKFHNIVSGYPDGRFQPWKEINRAELTKIIVLATYPDSIDGCIAKNGSPFKDVPKDAWYAPYVCVAKDRGLVGGYPDGTFQPARNINVVEAAKIIANAFSLAPGATGEPWYKPYIDALSAKNALPLYIEAFDEPLDRGTMAEMIYRIHGKVNDKATLSYEDLIMLQNDPIGFYIGKLKDRTFVSAGSYGSMYPAVEELTQIGKDAIPRLITVLESKDDFEFKRAHDALFQAAQHDNVRPFTERNMPGECDYTWDDGENPLDPEVRACIQKSWQDWYTKFQPSFEASAEDTTSINLYYVMLEDGGQNGRMIGCNDSVVAVPRVIPKTKAVLRASLETLLAVRTQYYGDSRLYYNSLQASTLQIESLSIVGEEVTIRLKGGFASGGVCDDPRIYWQIAATAMQFPTIKSVKLFLNGEEFKG